MAISKHNGPIELRQRSARRAPTWTVGLWLAALSACAPRSEPAKVQVAPPPVLTRPAVQELSPNLLTRTPVLTYHDIIERRDSKSVWFDATEKEFRGQIEWLLAQGAEFISLERLAEGLTGQEALPKNAVVLTFADNYLGFYKRALPYLRKRRIPAAMFVHTGYVGSPVGRPKMDWSQLRELAEEGLVTLGSQTVSHPEDLTKLDDAALRREMEESKSELERQTGVEVWALAYPRGKFDDRCAEAARAAGYRIAFTEEQRPAETAASILLVPRYVHTKYRQAWEDGKER
ncbi:MAG: polysaccharide deacetylase family protein [Fimbriimonadaceae bacterium]|nr:polysaccharide deacetylase family protein [Fimbriimonadaceae bacterium]QYK58487.1 MAG: polysaccharide deacetylase family protein [Fimbriimonadaceae bacterium]